MRLVECFIV